MALPAHIERHVVGYRPRRTFDWFPVDRIREARQMFNEGRAIVCTYADDDYFYLVCIPRKPPGRPRRDFFSPRWPLMAMEFNDAGRLEQRRSLKWQETVR